MAEKTPDKIIQKIKKMLKAGYKNYEVVDACGVSERVVGRVKRGMTDQLPPKIDKKRLIAEMLMAGKSTLEIMDQLHVNTRAITLIRRELADKLPVSVRAVSETERLRQQSERREIARICGKKTFYEMIGEDITAAIRALPEPKPLNVKPLQLHKQKQEPEEMIVKFSDSQIGSVVNMDETGGLGAYNSEIFLERLEYFRESLKKIFEIHLTSTPCPRIHLFFLGDIVDGRLIFHGQTLQTDKGVIEQCIFAENEIAKFIAWVAELYPWQVVCSCVIGNHGRIGQKGELSVMDNFDYSVYKHLEKYLSNYKNVSFNIPNSPRMIIEIMNRRHLLNHGDACKSWAGIPFYGIERSSSRYRELFQDAGEYYDYIHIGHFHQTAAIKGKQFINGCWPGGSQFSIDVMQVSSIPTQQFHSVHPIHGIVVTREIQLCDPRNLKGKVKIYK